MKTSQQRIHEMLTEMERQIDYWDTLRENGQINAVSAEEITAPIFAMKNRLLSSLSQLLGGRHGN